VKSIIFFRVDVPGIGDSVRVQDDVAGIDSKLRAAHLNHDLTIEVTTSSGRALVIPIDLIGPFRDYQDR
jgi:hypothetical protein